VRFERKHYRQHPSSRAYERWVHNRQNVLPCQKAYTKDVFKASEKRVTTFRTQRISICLKLIRNIITACNKKTALQDDGIRHTWSSSLFADSEV
jgi:hypothetical protein